MSSYHIGIDGTILLRITDDSIHDEVHWHSSDKHVATVEWVDFTKHESSAEAGIARSR